VVASRSAVAVSPTVCLSVPRSSHSDIVATSLYLLHYCRDTVQTVWECILPINIPRTFLASLCDLFRFSSRFYVFYFRISITSGFECVQPCRCARRACVRACAQPRYLACWHGNRRHMTSCFAAGDALLVDGVHHSSCCRWINSVFPWITFFPAVRGWVQVCPRCLCLHVFPSFGSGILL